MPETKVQIASTNGMLSAVIHTPEVEGNKLAILCPGYLDSKDYKNIVVLAEDLTKRGYTVVRFDPTGTWDSEGDISKYTMSQCIEDIHSILYDMREQKHLRDGTGYTETLIGGHSRGATVAILYAARDPGVTQVLAIMPQVGKESENLHRYVEWKKTNDRVSYRDLPDDPDKKREFHVPFSFAQDADRYNVIKEVKKTKAAVILVAGELDETCTPDSIKKIHENAIGVGSDFVTIPGIDHDYRHNEAQVKLVNETALNLVPKRERSLSHSY